MRYAISLVLLAALSAAGAAAQEQPQYQSVAPKKKKPKPLDPADVATLTGRPVHPSVAALPKAKDTVEAEATDDGEETPSKRPPLNQEDVDILTGKRDSQDSARYRYRDTWEALWLLEWMERGGYVGTDQNNVFFPGSVGRDGRVFISPHHRSSRHRLFPRHFRGGSFFFLFR